MVAVKELLGVRRGVLAVRGEHLLESTSKARWQGYMPALHMTDAYTAEAFRLALVTLSLLMRNSVSLRGGCRDGLSPREVKELGEARKDCTAYPASRRKWEVQLWNDGEGIPSGDEESFWHPPQAAGAGRWSEGAPQGAVIDAAAGRTKDLTPIQREQERLRLEKEKLEEEAALQRSRVEAAREEEERAKAQLEKEEREAQEALDWSRAEAAREQKRDEAGKRRQAAEAEQLAMATRLSLGVGSVRAERVRAEVFCTHA